MRLLHMQKYAYCSNFTSSGNPGFAYFKLKKGEHFIPTKEYELCLYFFLEGEALFTLKNHPGYRMKGNESILLVKDTLYTGEALTNLKFIIFFTNRIPIACPRPNIEYAIERLRLIEYQFKGLEIKPSLQILVESIKFYLENGINCYHLHHIKERELFLVLSHFYSPEELLSFYYPVINHNFYFRDLVLRQHLQAKNVKELAELCNLSVRSLNRKFRKYFNESPSSWLMAQKVIRIKNRLIDLNIPINMIIEEFNFTSPAHFTIFCKKQLGMTPTMFRKQFNN